VRRLSSCAIGYGWRSHLTGGTPITTLLPGSDASRPTSDLSLLSVPPRFERLVEAALEALQLSCRVADARDGWVNGEGGDVGCSGSRRSLLRHTANYLAARELAERHGRVEQMVDVGAGVGTLSVWLAQQLGVPLHLVDADPQVRRVARAAFPEIEVHGDLADLPQRSTDLVTAMEVIEHIRPEHQRAFVADLGDLVAPGGLLVLSTPDESDYLGGWSGYEPHVGVLDADSLRQLVASSTGLPTVVWRLEGEPFELAPWRQVVMPVANRTWATIHGLLPEAAGRIGHVVAGLITHMRGWRQPHDDRVQLSGSVRAVPPTAGHGTGLIAVAVRPAG
jgi:SAM-dependent methyltransferase